MYRPMLWMWTYAVCCVLAVFATRNTSCGLWEPRLCRLSYSTTPLKQRVGFLGCVTIHDVYP